MKKDTLLIIEGVCYLHPHKEELSENSLAMQRTWQHSLKLASSRKNAYFAPLLVDDLVREKNFGTQSVASLLKKAVGRSYGSLRWFGKPVLESDIERQYGNLGCKMFDALYHKDVLASLELVSDDWKWIAVHPSLFKGQQSGMLLKLWNLISENIDFSAVANATRTDTASLREGLRTEFLSHFEHQWINAKGEVESVTRPAYQSKKIVQVAI